jgi:two-component system LytT family response regulator
MNVLIVDDELNAQKALSILIKALKPNVNIVGLASSVNEAVEIIVKQKLDLVFLDINLGGENAFDLLNRIEKPAFHLVFVTAYSQFALKAFEYSAMDYLVKPIDHDDLIRVFEKLDKLKINSLQTNQMDTLKEHLSERKDYIIINTEKEYCRVKIDDIVRLEADGNYSHVKTTNGKRYVVSKGLKHFEELLGELFFRVHHGHLINVNAITRIITSPDYQVELQNNERCPVSHRKKKELMDVVGKLMG